MPRGVPNAKPAEVPLPPVWVDEEFEVIEPVGLAPVDPVAAFDAPTTDEDAPMALVPVGREVAKHQTDNVITGLGMLAKMSEAEFTERLGMLQRGRERVETIQRTLMREGEDYGKVKGIDRPFLWLPGAEQLEKFYGLVAEQRTTRIEGIYDKDIGWLSPPFTYRTDTLVHLGDLTGPVVASVSASCNVWESRYRYRTAKATCPTCGREGLVRGKKDGPLAGRWWCPGRDGGCNSKFEPNATREDGSLLVIPPGKVENTDFSDLDETVIQLAQKRSYVAGIRRATGTSGLFTIDDDSPSVQQQAAASETGDTPVVEAAPGISVGVGAKTTEATQLQHDELARIAKDRGLNGAKIADLLGRLFNMDVEPTGRAASTAVRLLDAEQMGALLRAVSTGEIPTDPADEARAPSKATN